MTATAVRWRLAAMGLPAAGVTAAIYLASRLIQPDYTFSLLALSIYGKLPAGPWQEQLHAGGGTECAQLSAAQAVLIDRAPCRGQAGLPNCGPQPRVRG
jgi:hypothetical protein